MLGSGGHTAEMLSLLKKFELRKYKPFHIIVAGTDHTSIPKLESNSPHIANCAVIHRIYRSREVGQNYFTSIFTTLWSIFHSFTIVAKIQPDLLLCNGPGTCVPICLSSFLLRCLGVCDPCIIFVESFCRVTSLSLSGRILYFLADRFVVQWPELSERFERAEYLGNLF